MHVDLHQPAAAASHVWAVRSADGGADGLEFARARVDSVDSVLVHAAPRELDVEVFAAGERLIAAADRLLPDEGPDSPMTRLTIDGVSVLREAVWPTERDLGSIVILPGGEAGLLQSWEDDRRRWTWSLVFRGGAT
jgi:hypothetical protein